MLNISLPDSTFRDLRDFIYEKCGIYISDSKKYLIENRLTRILQEKNLKSFEEYFNVITHSSNGNEVIRLFDAITTNETYFFREPEQLRLFVEEIFPKLLVEKKGAQKVKIWSAACSSGEEPYTIAMMLLEKTLTNGNFEIHATDLSEGVLASAKRATYMTYSVRNIPERYLKRHFRLDGNAFRLNSNIQNSVRFRKLNLINETNTKMFQGMDVIFCRNVLIYFDQRAKQKVVSHLYNCLNPGGYLFIGSSESLHSVTRAFRPVVVNKTILYQKV